MHHFHIPVLGLGYSVDTPAKVAHLGISSVISIVDDIMTERMRRYHSLRIGEAYSEIKVDEPDFRSKRFTAYLDLIGRIVAQKIAGLRLQEFTPDSELTRYFKLLPDNCEAKQDYLHFLDLNDGPEREAMEQRLKDSIQPGDIDVNIMSKVDKLNKDASGDALADAYSDASAALRGFAQSTLTSSLVLSAGMNPRLYNYLDQFADFMPDEKGNLKKKIILKVSDFRSALIQAKYLAKKGIWVSEFRIESGLNCGGHAFATEGYLLGPILEEFKEKRAELKAELLSLYVPALAQKEIALSEAPAQKITVQGGIGTAKENQFLLDYYAVDATGWGSPFLLVPETTNVDKLTLQALESADASDYYVSDSSPLGVLFNNFRNSTAEKKRLERIAKGRPGSPCKKKYLVSNTEFTAEPICTASREYQNLKINQLRQAELPEDELKYSIDKVTEKLCLCDGLSTSTLLKNQLLKPREDDSVSICPGPNLAWFSRTYTLNEMVDHIYGRQDLLLESKRPMLFINELKLYVEHLKKEIELLNRHPNEKKRKSLIKFKDQLLRGIQYYLTLVPEMEQAGLATAVTMRKQLVDFETEVEGLLPQEIALAKAV